MGERRLDSIPPHSFIKWLIDAMAAGGTGSDAIGRARASLPYQEAALKFTDDLEPGRAAVFTAGSGAVVHAAGEAYAKLSVSASGDRALLRTRVPQRAGAGLPIAIIPTSIIEAPSAANVVHRIGYLSDTDGASLQVSNGVASFVVRDSLVPLEVAIDQDEWNKDAFNGSGASGETLDFTKTLLLAIDLQSLSAGQVRFGFVIGGALVWAHWEDYSNESSTGPFMSSANLHMAWEIEATGAPGATINMRALSGAVIREGGGDEPVVSHVAARLVTAPATVPANQDWVSLLSVRVKDAYKAHASALPSLASIFSDGVENLAWRVMRIPFDDVPAGIVTWADVSPESACEMSSDSAVVDITKGKTYAAGYGAGGAVPAMPGTITGQLDASGLGLTDDGSVADIQFEQDVMVLAVAKLSNIGTARAHGSLKINEVR